MKYPCIPSRTRSLLLSDRFALIHSYIQIITMLGWLIILANTSSFYVIYLLLGHAGFWCRSRYNENKHLIFTKAERSNVILSSIFSIVLITANYDIPSTILSSITELVSSPDTMQTFANHFLLFSNLIFIVCLPFLFLGGIYVTFFVLRFVEEKLMTFTWPVHRNSLSPRRLFLQVFFAIGAFYSFIFFLGFYPGVISIDSINQLTQITTGHYTNWHPFFHTNLIRPFIFIGTSVFHDINIGVALYSLFSVLLISASFSYVVVTLYQLNMDKRVIFAVTLFYMIIPHYIMFSFTMWKDVPFSASILLFTCSVFRYFKRIGKHNVVNAAMLILSAFGICLFRGNGLIVMFLILILCAVFFGKTKSGLCFLLSCVLAVSLILFYPVLNYFHIEQADTVELLSVPLQQISRTLVDNDDVPKDQLDLISKVANPDDIRMVYKPYISDPIKTLIRKNHQDYLNSHKWEYAGLYFRMGITHPCSYLTAWIDLTKGYWNGGYEYNRNSYKCQENDLGVKRTGTLTVIEKGMFFYTMLYEKLDLLKPFVSIGLHTWLILLLALIGYRKKDKLAVFLTVPCLAVIFTLLIGTPVFAEFRYAYSLFCCLPFLAVITFRGKSSGNTDNPPLAKAIMDGDTTHEH